MALPDVIFLGQFDTDTLLARESRAAGTYTQKTRVVGNSILSSLFIESIDPGATLKINYYDVTTGDAAGERYDLEGHDLVTDTTPPLTTFRILVTKIHNNVRAEAIVTGGNVKFGVMATTVSSSASDIDAALIRDGDTFLPTESRAMPAAVLDRTSNKVFFLTGRNGLLGVTSDVGAPWFADSDPSAVTTPGSESDVLTFTVPADKVRNLSRVNASCRMSGTFRLYVDTAIIASGRTAPGNPNILFKFDPSRPIGGGTVVTLKFEAMADLPISGIEAFVMASDVNA